MEQEWRQGLLRLLLLGLVMFHSVLGTGSTSIPSCSTCVHTRHRAGDCAGHHPGAHCPLTLRGQKKIPAFSCALSCPHHHRSAGVSAAGEWFLLSGNINLPLPLFLCFTGPFFHPAYPDGYPALLFRPPPLCRI